MKIGIMGGTFDPIHLGHLLAAERVGEACSLDEVWLMPASIPPHKLHAPLASAEHRLEMVKRAADNNPRFRVMDYELVKGGTSYTVDTVTELMQLYPGTEFSYIMGADMIMYLPKWHRIGDLAKLVQFIGVARPGFVLRVDELEPMLQERITIVPMPQMDISSTDIRERIREGLSVRYLVSAPVLDYMEVNRLYET
ncbi:nicotinate-nucleotide adenylyltransferase [Gorillibacterium timonense]|uniref:nicotinate-nucleotide adenylyltransferase n=1 Tax=Gorillibacterium timonense TaxID=1689269 RepID=UPI00071E3551|nr:nicotinate-nucleotide adenylyltransferase [Gorillibacterium timonense]